MGEFLFDIEPFSKQRERRPARRRRGQMSPEVCQARAREQRWQLLQYGPSAPAPAPSRDARIQCPSRPRAHGDGTVEPVKEPANVSS